MKLFNFSSPYSRIGIFFALVTCACAAFVQFDNSFGPEPTKIIVDGHSFQFDFEKAESEFTFDEDIKQQHEDFKNWASDVPNFRDIETASLFDDGKEPCFTVKIDPTVKGADIDYRSDLFGATQVVAEETFAESLKEAMTEEFLEEVWARNQNCFKGTFVVSFDVTDDGRLGKEMLVHHLTGASNSAGIAVLDVLRDMDTSGHLWHDGSQGAGEVRIPISFKLN